MIGSFPPGLILVVGAFLLPAFKGTARSALLLLLPILTLVTVWAIPDGTALSASFLGYELAPVHSTALGRLFATVFSIMAFAGGLFALNRASVTELSAAFAYAGSAIGVTFAGDLVTMFVFWELMAVGSTVVIWSSDQAGAYRASMRYLMIHLMGGVLLMFGVIGHIIDTGSVTFTAMQPDSIAHWMILAGFLVNAGAPPLGAWIADAYPEASATGMVFLSAFTTKTAVFALMVGFPGAGILIPIGLYMAVYGIFYALLENDMRRILAYSIVNQVGFMVTAVGIGSEMALNGAAAHAFTHIIYKALLLMSAGSVLVMTGKRKCTDLGGLFRTMPFTATAGIIGALAISSFPFTSGFVSKSMTNQSAADAHLLVPWLILTAASAGVFLHAGIKFPWFVFFQKDSGLRPPDPPFQMRLSMGILAAACIGLGIWYQPLYALLPYGTDYEPYTALHLVQQFQLLLFSGLAFFLLLPLMKRTLTISLDFDWFYRVFGAAVARGAAGATSSTLSALEGGVRQQVKGLITGLFRAHGPMGPLARSWPARSMVLWVAILLAAFLILDLSRL